MLQSINNKNSETEKNACTVMVESSSLYSSAILLVRPPAPMVLSWPSFAAVGSVRRFLNSSSLGRLRDKAPGDLSPQRMPKRSSLVSDKYQADALIAASAMVIVMAKPNTRSAKAAATHTITKTEQRRCAAA